ncbi:levanase [Dyadobacter frigoris]|uniref:glycoside hydrolase family 32 protein n=1 Tax=Dyadobacter frigoris TaxID=2576211 RepID=UPI00249FDFB2|nr:glycoside hydrolase family 32 protein [Dyadobacter frigoris]GLU51300.1 levanase [Dyadobacter frigoris]
MSFDKNMCKIKLVCIALLVVIFKGYAQPQTPVVTPQWRPQYHFSAPANWINDPNGLLYLHGEYHLYYQYNPFENQWGHMSWGHATSKDLVHWKNLPVAIPELITKDTTTMIFSGSAVWDKNNTSGLGKGDGPVVAFYTGHLPKQKKQAQYMAFSNDRGATYTNYHKNPVIDINYEDFRDPGVFWHESSEQWVMVVSLVKDMAVRFYGSKDLKKWEYLSDFGKQGWTKNDWECPFIVPLAVDGNPKNTKWVMMISSGGPRGPLIQYFIGDFDGRTFKNDNTADVVLTSDYGDSFYAAIPWNNAPDNKKILLGWLQPGRKETFPWKGQMSIPRDLSLKTTPEGIRLVQSVSSVISNNLETLSSGRHISKNLTVDAREIRLDESKRFNTNSNWIEADFFVGQTGKCGFKIAQLRDASGKVIKEIEIGYDAKSSELYVDCSKTEKGIKDDRNLLQKASMKPENGKIEIRVLLDKSSLEVFGNGGEKVITTMIFPDEKASGMSIFSQAKNMSVEDLNVWDLSKK